MSEKKNVLFVIGSLRKDGFQQQLSEAAREVIGDRANIDALDYADVPFMNQDIEYPAPAAVARIREQVSQADALWIFTPEYNHGVPGALKNAIDWLSRPVKPFDFETPSCLVGKPVAISGAAGGSGAKFVLDELEGLLGFLRADMLAERTGANLDREAFTTGKLTISDEVRAALSAQADALLSR